MKLFYWIWQCRLNLWYMYLLCILSFFGSEWFLLTIYYIWGPVFLINSEIISSSFFPIIGSLTSRSIFQRVKSTFIQVHYSFASPNHVYIIVSLSSLYLCPYEGKEGGYCKKEMRVRFEFECRPPVTSILFVESVKSF